MDLQGRKLLKDRHPDLQEGLSEDIAGKKVFPGTFTNDYESFFTCSVTGE
jgi:hypothetical protein